MDFDRFKSDLLDYIKPKIHYSVSNKINRSHEGIGMCKNHIITSTVFK